MSEIRDRAREKIARLSWMDSTGSDNGWETSYGFIHKTGVCYELADQILSIKELAIVDREIGFPTYGLPREWIGLGITEEALLSIFDYMLKAGWVKEVKDADKDK